MTLSHESIEDFDLNLLRVLEVLLRTRGVTRAAAELGLTQSGVSRSLARLRRYFGDPLLVRDGRHMVPTAVALALVVPVGRLLTDAQMLFVSGRGFDADKAQWAVRIASAGYVEHTLMPGIMAQLLTQAPGVDVHMVHGDDVDALLEGRLDFAIAVDGELEGSDLVRTPLFTDELCCVVRHAHPVVEQGLCLSRFVALDHVLIAPGGTPGGFIDVVLARQGLSRRVRAQVSSFTAPMSLIANSNMIVTLPRRIATQLYAHWDVQILTPPLERMTFTLCAYWSAHRRTDPAHRWFRGVITQAAKSL